MRTSSWLGVNQMGVEVIELSTQRFQILGADYQVLTLRCCSAEGRDTSDLRVARQRRGGPGEPAAKG